MYERAKRSEWKVNTSLASLLNILHIFALAYFIYVYIDCTLPNSGIFIVIWWFCWQSAVAHTEIKCTLLVCLYEHFWVKREYIDLNRRIQPSDNEYKCNEIYIDREPFYNSTIKWWNWIFSRDVNWNLLVSFLSSFHFFGIGPFFLHLVCSPHFLLGIRLLVLLWKSISIHSFI